MPKQGKPVKNNALKMRNPEKVKIGCDSIFTKAITDAKTTQAMTTLDWDTFSRASSLSELHDMRTYMLHDKTNIKHKLDKLSERQESIKGIVRVRDWSSQALETYQDLSHDAIVKALQDDELPETKRRG